VEGLVLRVRVEKEMRARANQKHVPDN
jgi:hypothetical protein